MEENKRISDLFERARNEAPMTTFNQAKRSFLTLSAVGATGLLAKWAAASFKLKAIIMITTLSTLTISGIIIATQLSGEANVTPEKAVIHEVKYEQNVEISNKNGIEKTVMFDDKNQIVEVRFDSSNRMRRPIQQFTISTTKPELLSKPEKLTVKSTPFSETPGKSKGLADSLTLKKFVITHKTTAEELKHISAKAQDAGIEFAYDTRIRRDVIKKIEITMVIQRGDDKSKSGSKISGATSFSFDLGWWEDASGRAVQFLCSTSD